MVKNRLRCIHAMTSRRGKKWRKTGFCIPMYTAVAGLRTDHNRESFPERCQTSELTDEKRLRVDTMRP
jgi:hypothetical protein